MQRNHPTLGGLRWKLCASSCSALALFSGPAAWNGPDRALRDILARLGDRSTVRGGHVESDRNWAWLYLEPRARQEGARGVRVAWEQTLVAGAFRDAMGQRLWGWTGSDGPHATDFGFPYRESFPSPPERVFRKRVAQAAKRWHFRVLELRYLQPVRGAPLVVVSTKEPARLARAAGAIRSFLAGRRYEGFYFEAKGAFVFAAAYRGTNAGMQWARSEELYPFPHG